MHQGQFYVAVTFLGFIDWRKLNRIVVTLSKLGRIHPTIAVQTRPTCLAWWSTFSV